MKIFIGCSSSEEIRDEYKIVSKYLIEKLSENNDLVFGCANRGLMGICYNSFLNNNRKIYGICNEKYIDEIKNIKCSEIKYVKSFEESNNSISELSDLILILPGSFGTLSELIDTLEEKRTNIHNKDIILFNINGFYDDLINMFDKIYNNVSNKYDFNNLCKVFRTADEILEYIKEKNC